MKEHKEQPFAIRHLWYITLAVFFIIVGRLWYLQIIQGDQLTEMSAQNSQQRVALPAPRGLILDRNNQILVSNRLAYSLQVVPADLTKTTLMKIARYLSVTPDQLQAKIDQYLYKGGSKSSPLTLVHDIPPPLILKIEEALPELTGVRIHQVFVRYYPYMELGAHLFGHLGQITRSQLEEKKREGLHYRYDDVIGMVGLEKVYEKDLKGIDGSLIFEVDATKKNLRLLEEIEPIPGKNLKLTIDLPTQLAAEQIIRDHLSFLRDKVYIRGARSGGILALDPKTGGILALVSYPSYDPNNFVSHVSTNWYQKMIADPARPFLNRVLQAYPPGSTFKAVTVLAALEENKVSLKELFNCTGYDPVYGAKKKCWTVSQHKPPHGPENIIDGIKNSCNIVFFELGRRLGIDKLAEYARMLGFEKATGFSFYPEEKTGLIPDREFKRKNYRRPEMAKWYPIETLDVAIGQGAVSTTPLQIAQLYQTIANRGKVFRPYVVSEITDHRGKTIKKMKPELLRELKLQKSSWEILEKGLIAVASESGTAAMAFYNAPYKVAGKTGTAQNSAGKPHGWFAGYAPVEDPRIVVVVLVEHGESGSGAAAPIARRVMDAYLRAGR